ncbi:MAG TPA: hypothetical protein VF204_10360 [Streptosporangiaceae bacterium]
MRNRSIRGLYVLAASVAVSSALGLAGATAASAGVHAHPHATTVCDNNPNTPFLRCTNISSLLLNQNNGPAFIQNATQKGVAAGSLYKNRIINLRQASNTRTNEDFIIRFVGFTDQLCGTGGVNSLDPTSYACLNYPDYPVFQGQFAPNSNESGFCVGAISATEGFKVRLRRCGTPQTFWVADLAASITVTFPGGHPGALLYFPLEFAADTSASNPLVLTLNPNSKNPTNLLTLQQENFSGGSVPDRQMFTLTRPVGFTIP